MPTQKDPGTVSAGTLRTWGFRGREQTGQRGTDIDKEGDDQHDDGQFQVWVLDGVQEGHLKGKRAR